MNKLIKYLIYNYEISYRLKTVHFDYIRTVGDIHTEIYKITPHVEIIIGIRDKINIVFTKKLSHSNLDKFHAKLLQVLPLGSISYSFTNIYKIVRKQDANKTI